MAKKVRVGKIDLDTVGAVFLLGVTREDEVAVIRGDASPEDLANPDVICIEVGGSGQVRQMNFDHHAADGPTESATRQVFANFAGLWVDHSAREALTNYVNLLDLEGGEALRERTGGTEFPTLSDVFAGMLLTERNPVEQLHKGVELLKMVVETGIDPFGTIKGFDAYAKAKAENNRQIAEAVHSAQWDFTHAKRRLTYVETEFFGAPGALYGHGAEIVVAFNPRFGNPPIRKFTVAGNGIRVDAALELLNALEQGWGGPATGTIIGSPREGSKLTLKEVVEIVRSTL